MQYIGQQLHKGDKQILAHHIFWSNERPALIGENGFHIPGRHDRLGDGQQQQNVTADRAHRTPLLLAGLLLFRQTRQIARRHVATTKTIPEAANRVGTPRIGEHGGAFRLGHRLQLGTSLIVLN